MVAKAALSMIRTLLTWLAAFALAEPALAAASSCGPKRVALTFDDAPRAGTAVMSGWERSGRIIAALHGGGVDQAAFFSLSDGAVGEGRERLLAYAAAGHAIANHSASHPNLHRVGAERFIEDVRKAHGVLSKLPGFTPLFRFPMLNEGTSNEERDKVRAALEELGYRQGYVTIDTFDFYIDNFLHRTVADGKELDRAALGRLYVRSIVGAAEHYNSLACNWLKRSPAHVLLLHENDVAALYLSDLIAALRADGWTIIPATEAYADPIAATSPDTLLLGQGRVAALAHLAGASPDSLRHASESTDYLDRQFRSIAQLGSLAQPEAASEIAAIAAQSARFSKAYVDGDLDTLVSIYTADGVAAPGGRDFIRGREALREFWRTREGVDVISHKAVPEEISVAGRLAYDWGRYSGATRVGSEIRPFGGKYLIVWERGGDGVWRMANDMWNSGPDGQ